MESQDRHSQRIGTYRILTAILIAGSMAFAEEIKFKDVPEHHWAEPAVYRLVKLGATQGYPDGTYRGTKNISRYEMANFLSNLSEKLENQAQITKLLAELKNEFATAKYQIENPEDFRINAEFSERFRASNTSLNSQGPHGPRLDYRLKVSALKNFSSNRSIKINLDSMDAGYNGGDRDLATKLLDIEGRARIGAFDLKATAGPGTVVHTETDGTLPSEDYYIYIRPKGAAHLSTKMGALDLSLSYVTRQMQLSGLVGVSEITGTLAYNYKTLPLLSKTRVALTPRYLWKNGERDLRGELQIDSYPTFNLSGQLLLGAGHLNSSKGLYVKGILAITNPYNSFSLRAHKAGSEYRSVIDKYEFVFLDYFNKLVLDGSVDVGCEFIQKLNDRLSFKWTSDAVLTSDFKYGENHPGTSLTHEIDLGNETINLFYRSYFVPSGISSADPTMARNIATTSDLLGFAISLKI
jgi:hypothetical protein